MNNVFVYCEIEGTQVQEVSQELLTKGRKLANTLGVELHAVVAGTGIKDKVEDQILPYGVDKLFVFDAFAQRGGHKRIIWGLRISQRAGSSFCFSSLFE